jgi:hypothetical protein
MGTFLFILLVAIAICARVAEWFAHRERPISLGPKGLYALVFWLALACAALVLIATGDAEILFSRTATEP